VIVRHRSPFGTARFELARLQPVRPLAVDRTFDQLVGSLADARRRTPVVDTSWHDGRLRLTVDLPGVPADAVDVRVADRTLTLAVRTDELTWERSVRLGATLDPDQVSARHVDGRLTVEVGAAATPEPRRIAIDTTSPAAPAAPAVEAIEATSVSTDESTDGEVLPEG
jgi:HSP20 family protein